MAPLGKSLRSSFEPQLLSTYCVLGTPLGLEAAIGGTIHHLPMENTHGVYVLVRHLDVLNKPQILTWGSCLMFCV